MIVRIWHGWTEPADADAYQRLLDEEVVPGIVGRHIPGFERIDVLRRRDGDDSEVEFVTIMRFEHWAAVETFAGPDGGTSVVPPAARALLSRFDAHAGHYEIVGSRAA